MVAFGDGDNDKEFLSVAGLGVAMINARASANEGTDAISEKTNSQNGVVHELCKLLDAGAIVPAPVAAVRRLMDLALQLKQRAPA